MYAMVSIKQYFLELKGSLRNKTRIGGIHSKRLIYVSIGW